MYSGLKKSDKNLLIYFPYRLVLEPYNKLIRWVEIKIRHFSSEEKTKIVLALLKEDLTLVELSSKYGVTSKTLQNWKRQFLEHASIAFDPSKVVSVYKDEINTLKHQNDELAKALGKATVERDWAV